jgi:hypothetical protein
MNNTTCVLAIAWIPYADLREFANTTIEPMTTNRLPRLFMVEIGK